MTESQNSEVEALRVQLAERDALVESQARQIAALTGSIQDINAGWDKTLDQLAEREAVIERVREWLGAEDDWADDLEGSWPAPIELQAILAASPSTVLADLIREKQAEAWSERGRDTFPFASKLNPYRKGTEQ